MSRESTVQTLMATRLVPVVRAPGMALARAAASALLEGGVRALEITLTVPGATALIAELAREADKAPSANRPVIGAGTVRTLDQARAALEAGARFIVSPGLDVDLVAWANDHDVAVMPGGLTPSEIIAAWNAGADMVKVFPCSAVGGVSYLKSLRAPLPDIRLFPTGGVTIDNVGAYLRAGAAALGVGSNLVDVRALEAGKSASLVERTRSFVTAIADVPAARPAPSPLAETIA